MFKSINPFRRFIIARFLAVFIPSFAILTLLALYAIAESYIENAEDVMTARIGNQMGRVSSLIGNGSIDDDPKMVSKIASTLLADPAIVCSDVVRNSKSIKELKQPKNLGCRIMKPASVVEIPVLDNHGTQLRVGFTNAEIELLRKQTLWFAIYTTLFGSIGAVVIGISGFRFAVGKPINDLKNVMKQAEVASDVRAEFIDHSEIGQLKSSFNSLQDKIKEEQQKTEESLESLRNVYNETPALLFTMNSSGKITSASGYWLKETGYNSEDVVGNELKYLLKSDFYVEFREHVLPRMSAGDILREIPLCLIYHDGREVDVLLSIDKDKRQNSDDGSYVCVMNDVSALRRAERKLHDQAITDELTKLPNRRGLVEYFENIRNGNYPNINHCTVLFIDLDNFKSVNDTHGHQVGDGILRVAANKIKQIVGSLGMIARIGGDEFAVVIASETEIENIEFISKKIVSELSRPIRYHDICCFIGASIGIANSKNFPDDLPETLQCSDQAMYLAKSSGKNQTCMYDEDKTYDIQNRAELVQLVQTGIVEDAFDIFFQPIIDLGNMRPFSLEALLRVTKIGKTQTNIENLIRVAEETGQMEKLGLWILRKSISNFNLLINKYPHSNISLNINLSPQQLSNKFVREVKGELVKNPKLAERLIFEITETAAIDQFEKTCILLQEIREMGIRIALDDFGSGYSSLSYISQLPIDILKLDKSFIQTTTASPSQLESVDPHVILVRALAQLATELGLVVVVEGVETIEIMEKYHHLGVRLGQGYLFSKPMSVSDAELWLKPYIGNQKRALFDDLVG